MDIKLGISLRPGWSGLHVRKIGPDFIDYWQGPCDPAKSLRNRFGLRLRDGHIWVLVKFGDEPPNTYGIGYPIPVAIEGLPAYVAMIVNDHLLNYPSSDLMDVLTGKESLQDAMQFPQLPSA